MTKMTGVHVDANLLLGQDQCRLFYGRKIVWEGSINDLTKVINQFDRVQVHPSVHAAMKEVIQNVFEEHEHSLQVPKGAKPCPFSDFACDCEGLPPEQQCLPVRQSARCSDANAQHDQAPQDRVLGSSDGSGG